MTRTLICGGSFLDYHPSRSPVGLEGRGSAGGMQEEEEEQEEERGMVSLVAWRGVARVLLRMVEEEEEEEEEVGGEEQEGRRGRARQ